MTVPRTCSWDMWESQPVSPLLSPLSSCNTEGGRDDQQGRSVQGPEEVSGPTCLVIWIPRELLSTRQESSAQGRDSSGAHAAGAGQRNEGKQWLGLGFTSRGMDSGL